MTPYYQDSAVTIYHGDCREILPEIGKVDLVLTDPPYGTLDGKGKVTKRGNCLVSFNVGDWDKELPLSWIKDAIQILEDGMWLCCFTDNLSVKQVWDEIEKHGGNCKQTFYWIKTNPPPQPRNNFYSAVETACCATKGPVRKWCGGGWSRNWKQESLVTSGRVGHPTEKPIGIMSHLIQVFGGTLILDPFMGSGTTLRAAKDLGRKAIGIEIEERYCEIAAKRMAQEVLAI